ncbi:MAG: hypothetical protein EAZ80_09940 [Runella slithyformis]|nr:MAG: hypothetical protein EAZ80_09940 [Runella slithyformis]TAF30990.1 MAG: hypothetical protein EAZ67_13405 [Cytophagales bacterium]
MKTLLIALLFELNLSVEYGTLTIYRRRDYFTQSFSIKINNTFITKNLGNNEYLTVEVPTGQAIIETSGGYLTEKQTFTITVKKDEIYYLKGVVDYDYFSNALYLRKVLPPEAFADLKKLSLNAQLVKKLE